MSSVIQAAIKGERSAMHSLYKANKQKVWGIAYGLLLDQAQASSVAVSVFRDLWRELKLGNISSKEEFTNNAVNKTAEHCAAIILQKNPKAFQLPYDKAFDLPVGAPVNFNFETEPEFYLSNLPALHRLIFVLHTIGDWGALRIARVLQWDSAIVRTAIETEPDNLSHLQHQSGRDYYATYEEILQMFNQWEASNKIPEDAIRPILDNIDSLVSPQAEQAKRRKVSIAVFCAVVCIGLLAIILRSVDPTKLPKKNNNKAETTEAAEDVTTDPAETTEDPNAPYTPPSLDSDVTYYADIEIDSYGTIVIELDQEAAPITCANFVELAEMGFYDFLTIHSISDGSMIQGGDPTIGSNVSLGKDIAGEYSENGYDNPLSHTAGVITMDRSGASNSSRYVFSILRTDRTDMDGKYAAFGRVIEGMDVLEDICNNVIADESGYIEEDSQPIIDSLYIREVEDEIPEEDDYELEEVANEEA